MTSDAKSEQPPSLRDVAAEDRNALFDRVLDDIAIHGSVRQALRENRCGKDTFYLRLRADIDAQERYARAKLQGMEAIADEIMEIADECETSSDAVSKARVQIDSRKWLLSKLLPKRYGDKLDVAHSGEVTVNFTPGDASVL